MTATQIASAALRNSVARHAQLSRLQPMREIARDKVRDIRAMQDGAKANRKDFDTMQKLKWVPGFFPTPKPVIDRMLMLADVRAGMSVLEPSAGKGNIAKALLSFGVRPFCVEVVPALAEHLRTIEGLDVVCRDFLELEPEPFDRVVMNPPFESRADRAHVLHAFEFLKNGGRLVAVVSNTAGIALTEWANERGGFVEPLPDDAFATSERPTSVRTSLVVAYNDGVATSICTV